MIYRLGLDNYASWISTDALCSAFSINMSNDFNYNNKAVDCFFGVREIANFVWKSDLDPLGKMPMSHTWGI